ncbi:leukotoxin LktA family filamentous adhesin [Roseateles toxinivorans]|uniref:Hemagglutinin-like protein n=1 Tax=Roseateles toxinivorans TaxID=270368 RepID=A0A4R6QTN6_9BURK|nr:leukotoxin LktA family filamentous adhesin [Roseateles toxinivorans]TDP74757.1 hemagglutinin-like protein [Roseateles toxinivorans]
MKPIARPSRPFLQQRSQRLWRRRGRTGHSPRALVRLLALTPLGGAVAALTGLPAISAWAQTQANVIKPDGRTQTALQVSGTRTDISTATLRGSNAFNSFRRFEVGQGQTVNVLVPVQAQRVINLVTEAPVRVDGVLNGLKDGSLNGKLVFADPYGLVLGKEGVINVNSLHIVAPSKAHMDAMLGAQGQIGEAAVEQLLQGRAPRSAEGRVRIDGRINALERVRIEAGGIEVAGTIRAGADAAHDAAFRSAVNANGLSSAVGMVERGGVIELVGDEKLLVSGSVVAAQHKAPSLESGSSPAGAGLGGQVRLQGGDIELQAGSLIDVSGVSGGGSAVIGDMRSQVLPSAAPATEAPRAAAPAEPPAPLTQRLVLSPGAQVLADATQDGDGGSIRFLSDDSTDFGGLARSRGGALRGNGGFVEVSGRRRLQLYGLVDTKAPKGRTGTLLIDSDTLHIINGASGDSSCLDLGTSGDCSVTTGTVQTLAASNNVLLQAETAITLGGSDGAAATLDLSSAYTDSTDVITLVSKDITFNANSRLLTGGGAVKLIGLGSLSAGDLGTGEFSYQSSISWGPLSIGAKVEGGTVHLNSGAVIITRGVAAAADAESAALLRNGGAVTLRGQRVQLDAGSKILAQSTGSDGHLGGAVELTSYALQQWNLGKATAESQVVLAGTVKAETITANAVARAEATPDGAWGFALQGGLMAIGAYAGMNAAYHEAEANAHLDVQGTARLDASSTLSLHAASLNKAAGSVYLFTQAEDGTDLFSAAVAYVKTGGIADLLVSSGAQLKSGGKLSVVAHNDATAKSSVKVLSTNSKGGAAVGVVETDVSAYAQIAAGADIQVGSLELLSLQTGNVRNIAKSTEAQRKATEQDPNPPQASVGVSVAVSNIKAHSTALLDASLAQVGDVTVVADTALWQNYIAARNDVGGDPSLVGKVSLAVASKILPFSSGQQVLGDWLAAKSDTLAGLSKGAPTFKLGAVVTVNETDLGSQAHIGANAIIVSSGKVAVLAQTEDRSIHNIAESRARTKDSISNGPALSLAVAVGLYDHAAEATVGEGAQITTTQFGLQSQIYQPLDVTWLASFGSGGIAKPSELFAHFTPPNLGMPQLVFTSWATALTEQEIDPKSTDPNKAVAAAGAVNWTAFGNRSTAWVGSGAHITSTGADTPWSIAWTTPTAPLLDGDTSIGGEPVGSLGNILRETQEAVDKVAGLAKNAVGEITDWLDGAPVVLGITLKQAASFGKAVDVQARNESSFLTLTGQPSAFGFGGVKLGVQGGPFAAGAAFNYAGSEHRTVAGIDDGAVVTASLGTVGVEALSIDRIIAVAPTAGRGTGSVVNLIAAYAELDNLTAAVVSNKAQVAAKALDVVATEDVSVWSASGAAAFGGNANAVGVAVAVNELDGRTLAAIADPGTLEWGAVRPEGFSGRSATGSITTDALRVLAATQGTSGAVSASAASVESEDPDSKPDEQVKEAPKSGLSKKWEALKTKTSELRAKAVAKLQTSDTGKIAKARNFLADKIKEKAAAADPVKPTPPKLSIAAAGSAAVNLGKLDSRALVQGASLKDGAGSLNTVTVRASNETHQYAVSGSIALLKLNAPETQTGYGVSGAVTVDIEDNDSSARIVDSSISDAGTVLVESLSAGQRISAGLGIAGSSGKKPSYMLDVSYSMTESDNDTLAAIEGGTITGSAARKSVVEVLAYDRTETGVGAGALTVQKNKGGAVGVAIGVALVRNSTDASIAGTTATQAGRVDVRAFDPVVLGIGAASLGYSKEAKSFTLEGSVSYGEVENNSRAFIGNRGASPASINSDAQITVQATDLVPAAFKTRFEAVLAADGTPPADSEYDFGASLRAGDQEAFGGQAIGQGQPGALVIGVAGGIAVGSGEAAGASASVSRVANVHEALVEGATLTGAGVAVDATDASLIVNVGLGVGGTSSKIAFAGSVAVTINDNRATARIGETGKTTSVTTTGASGTDGLGITSATSDRAFAVAGALAISTSGTAGGLAGVVSTGSNVAEALARNATLSVGGSAGAARVESTTASQHIGVAAAGGFGDKAAINGSFVVHDVSDRTTASVTDSGVSAGHVQVRAGDSDSLAAQVYSGAGSIGFSGKVAGGAAVTVNTVALEREASIERSAVTVTGTAADALLVRADTGVRIIGVTVAGGGATTASINGAASANTVTNTTKAQIEGSGVNAAGAGVQILARDVSDVDFGTAAISVAGKVGLGAAIAVNRIDNDVSAQLQGSDAQGARHALGAEFSATDLRVDASSDARLVNAAYGIAAGGQVGGAGSISVNIVDTDVTAHIGRGASARLEGSAAVQATSEDDIKSFAGALGIGNGAGVGLSTTVNLVRGSTQASIGADDETQVKLDAKGNGAGLLVHSGVLTQPLPGVAAAGTNPSSFDGLAAMSDYDATRKKMVEGTKTIHGVAVNAASIRHVLAFDTAIGGAGEGVGIGANAGAHVISSATTAEVVGAELNQRESTGLAAAQALDVQASSHHVMSTFALGAGVGATAGGSAALGGDVFVTRTKANIRDAKVKAQQDVTVHAGNESAQSSILIGFAAGSGALTGTAGVVVFDAEVQAALLGGESRSGRDTIVDADNAAVVNVISGAGALSAGGGAAGAVTVVVSDTLTEALVGRAGAAQGSTRVSTGGDLTVQADSSGAVNTFTVAISGSGGAAGAAIGAVAVVTNQTRSAVSGADLEVGVAPNWVYVAPGGGGSSEIGDGPSDGPSTSTGPAIGALNVHASDHGVIAQESGAAGIGFGAGGVGGTVSVLVTRANVAASVDASEVDAGTISLLSLNQQQHQAATVGVGVGGGLGAGFAVSLTMLGTGSPEDSDAFGSGSNAKGSQLMDAAIRLTQGNRLGETADTISTTERSSLQAQGQRDIGGTLRDAGSNSAASTVSASTLRAGGNVTVQADQESSLKNLAGAAGVSLGVGAGGSVGVSYVFNATAADVTASTITAGGAVSLSAESRDVSGKQALDLTTIAGGVGFAGLGASVGVAHLSNTVSAQADGTITGASVAIAASDSTSASVSNVAAAAGGGALGIAVSTLDRGGSVNAWVNRAGGSGSWVNARTLDISAQASGSNTVISRAVAAGLAVSGNGAAGTVDDTMQVRAGIGDNSRISVSGDPEDASHGSNVLAQRAVNLSSEAWGVGVSGGVQLGGSVALVTLGGDTTASVGPSVQFDAAGALSVAAEENAANALAAKATASGGGWTAALNASVATVSNTAVVQASIGDATLLPDGDVTLVARHAAAQHSEASGVPVGGLLALGGNVADTTTTAGTQATLGNVKTSGQRLGDLSVAAIGSDSSTAKATAGGGGLISGQAAVANVKDSSTTLADLKAWGATAKADAAGYTLHAGKLSVDAEHHGSVRTDADTVNASVVGGSGAFALSQVNNSVTARLGNDLQASALGLSINSLNQSQELDGGDNAAGAGGGLANGSAVQAGTRFTTQSTVSVGERVGLTVFGDPTSDHAGTLALAAHTDLSARTKGSLNTGGLVDVPFADVQAVSDAHNTVSVGRDAVLRSVGDVVLGTTALNQMNADSLVKTYGAVSVAGGTSNASAGQTDSISLGSNALLQAYGNVSLATGRDALGGLNLVQAQAMTDVYNYTALPITTTNSAEASSTITAAVDLAGGSRIEAGRSVYLRTFRGDQGSSAHGEGHNPYLELFSLSTDDSHAHAPVFAGSVAVNGQVTAGYYRLRDLRIDASGQLTQTVDQPALALPVQSFTMDATGGYHDATGQLVDPALALKPKDYIARIDGFNPSRYYDSGAKEKLGNVPDQAMGAYALPDLFVAGGNVEVSAPSVSGSGSLRAQGGPLIRVANASNRYLLANRMAIPDADSGGAVTFLGGAVKPAGLSTQEVDKGRAPAIDLHNSYNTAFGGPASDIVFQSGASGTPTVRNPRGSFTLVNDFGNAWGAAPDALTVDIQVPQGTFVLESTGYAKIGGTPQNEWASWDALVRPSDAFNFIDTVAYALYIRWGIGSSTDAVTYSRQLQGIVENKGSGSGYLFRKNLGNQQFKSGGNWYDGHYLFDTLQVKTLEGTRPKAINGVTSPGLLANRVDISARYLDLNAPILAGTAREVDVTINNTKLYRKDGRFWAGPQYSFFECVLDPSCRARNALRAQENGLYEVPAASLTYGASSPRLTVTFDPSTRRVSTASIGGSSQDAVKLTGIMLNSNATGSSKIELSTGAMKLNLQNNSGLEIDLPRIETSSNSQGVIQITDNGQLASVYSPKLKRNVVAPLTTWYVSTDGQHVDMYQDRLASDYVGLTPVQGTSTENGASTTSYLPRQGYRYDWTRQATATRRIVPGQYWDYFYATDWEFLDEQGKATHLSTPSWSVVSSGVSLNPALKDINYSYRFDASAGFDYWNVTYSNNGPANRLFGLATSATLIQRSSVRADHPVAIGFKGFGTGGITIGSNASAHVGKTISNAGGDTSISVTEAGKLVGHDGGLITARNLTLSAAGDLGGDGSSQALNIRLNGGVLNAEAGGNLALDASSALSLGSVSAGSSASAGRLSVRADGDITAASAASVVKAFQVELESRTGRIGGAGADQALNVTVSSIGDQVSKRGIIKAQALGDVKLDLTGGDIRVDKIVATDGNVWINTLGSLFDFHEGEGLSGRANEDLLALWQGQLHLAGDRGAAAADTLTHTIAPLDQQVSRDYRDYWSLRALGTLGSGGRSITLSSAGLSTLRAQTAARLGIAQPSDAQVNAWANELLARYTGTFDSLLGANSWQSRPEFQAQAANYRFSADRYNEYWQLRNATSGGVLTSAGKDAVRAMAATVLGAAPNDAQLQAYVNSRFSALAGDFASGLGASWATQAAFQSYDPVYQFAGDAALLQRYATGSYWGQDRLENSIRLTALNTGSGGGTGEIEHLNISGKTVTLTSSGATATLGRDNGFRTLPRGQALSPEDRDALSLAVAPGDVQTLADADGNIIGLKVRDNRPFFLRAGQQLDASFNGQLFVQAEGELKLGRVLSTGGLRLLSQDGLSVAGAAAGPQLEGTILVLDGGRGSIGSAAQPLVIKSDELSLVRADGDIHIVQPLGNLVLDLMGAGQTVDLRAETGSIRQKETGLLSLSGHDLNLWAAGDIGGPDGRNLELRTTGGALTLHGQVAWIGASGEALRLGTSALASDLLLSAPETTDLIVQGKVTAGGKATLLMGGDFITRDQASLQTQGDVSLLAGGADMAAGSSLRSEAGALGLNLSGGDARVANLFGQTGVAIEAPLGRIAAAGAANRIQVGAPAGLLALNVQNSAGAGVGTNALPLQLDAARVAVRSRSGGLFFKLLQPDVVLEQLGLDSGDLFLGTEGSLRLQGGFSSAGNIRFQVKGAFEAAGSLFARGAGHLLQVDAGQITVAGLARSDGDLALASREGDMRLSDVQALGSIALRSARSLQLSSLTAGGDADAQAATSLQGGSFDAAGSLALGAGAALDAGGLGAGNALSVSASGAATLGALKAGTSLSASAALLTTDALQAGGDVSLLADGLLTARTAAVGGKLDARAAEIRLNGATVGRAATLQSGAALAIGRLDVGDGLNITAGAAAIGPLQVGGDLRMDAAVFDGQSLDVVGNSSVTITGEFRAAALRQQGDALLRAASLSGAGVTIGGTASVSSTEGGIKFDRLSIGGNAALQAKTSVLLGALDVGGSLKLDAERAELASVAAAGAAHLRLAKDLAVAGQLVFGADLDLRADSLAADGLQVAGATAVEVQKALSVGAVSLVGSADIKAGELQLKTLTAGADLKLDLRSAGLQADSLQVAGDTRLQARSDIDVRQLLSGGRLELQARDLRVQDMQAGGDAQLQLAGDWQLTQRGRFDADLKTEAAGMTLTGPVQVGGAAALRTGRLLAGQLRVGGATSIVAEADVELDSLQSGAQLDVQARHFRANDVQAGGDAKLALSGDWLLGEGGHFGAGLSATAARIDWAGPVQVLAAADLRARAGLSLTTLDVGAAARVEAGELSGKRISSGGASSWLIDAGGIALEQLEVGGAASLDTKGSMQIPQLDVAGPLRLQAGDLVSSMLHAAGDAALQLSGKLEITELGRFDGDLKAQASVMSFGALKVGGSLTLSTPPTPAVAGLGAASAQALAAAELPAGAVHMAGLEVGESAEIKLTGAFELQGSGMVGGDLLLVADALTLRDLTVGRALDLQSAHDLSASSITSGAGTSLRAPDAVKVGSLDVARELRLQAGSLTLGTLNTALDARLQMSRDATLGELRSGGQVEVDAAGDLRLDVLVGQGDASLKGAQLRLGEISSQGRLDLLATQDLQGQTLNAGVHARLRATGAIRIGSLSAPTVELEAGREMRLDVLRADTAELSTATQIALREGRIDDSIKLHADQISGGLVSTAGDGLLTELGGVDERPATRIELAVDTPLRWQVPLLNAVEARLTTTGEWTRFDLARITGAMRLGTPGGAIEMNNRSLQPSATADVQLYEPDRTFMLERDGKRLSTTAFLLAQRPDQIITSPRIWSQVNGLPSQTPLQPASLSLAGLRAGPLAAMFPQLRRTEDGGWDFEALLRENPSAAQQTVAVGELEF